MNPRGDAPEFQRLSDNSPNNPPNIIKYFSKSSPPLSKNSKTFISYKYSIKKLL